VKTTLANTRLKVDKLLKKLDSYEGHLGFDTEAAGPLLQGRDFINISYSALLGLSVAFEDEECFYLPVRHKGNNASFMDLHEVAKRLQDFAKRRQLWAHNCKFDHQVMIRAGYPLPGLLDSMIAAWLVEGRNKGIGLKELAARLLDRESPQFDPAIAHKTGQEVLQYACHDALNTLQLGRYYCSSLDRCEHDFWGCENHRKCIRCGMTPSFEGWFYEECDFAMLLAEMKLQGLCLDRKKLAEVRREGKVELDKISKVWNEYASGISITSSKQLQELFVEGAWVEHGRTATGAFATSKQAMLHNLNNANSAQGKGFAWMRLAHQEAGKIVNTYTDGLIEEALQWADKRLHPDLHHFGTVTGRLSSSHPNIQNQPARGNWAERIKACFIPAPGMEFTSADYSQVELRYFADYCGGQLHKAFSSGLDLHQSTADILGVDRQLGKTINFGFLLYGGGARKMAGLLGCSEKEAGGKIQLLQEGYPEVDRWRKKVVRVVEGRGPIPWCRTRAGRVRFVPELQPAQFLASMDEQERRKYVKNLQDKYKISDLVAGQVERIIYSKGKRLVVNYLVQGGSRDLLVLGMNEYRRRAPEGFSVVTTVHDEVLTQHPIGRGEDARSILKECLEGAGPKLGLKVPIVAEPKTGSNWAEVK